MGVKHVFAATFGGIVSALLGGFLVAPIMLLVHPDDGIIGWGLLDPAHAPVRGWALLFRLGGGPADTSPKHPSLERDRAAGNL